MIPQFSCPYPSLRNDWAICLLPIWLIYLRTRWRTKRVMENKSQNSWFTASGMPWLLVSRLWLIYVWKYPQGGISVWSPVTGWWWRRRPWPIEWTYCRNTLHSATHLSLEDSFASNTRKREISQKSTHWVWLVSTSTDLYMLGKRPKSRNVWSVESKVFKQRHTNFRRHLVTKEVGGFWRNMNCRRWEKTSYWQFPKMLLWLDILLLLSFSSSIGAAARCGLWPVEKCPSILSYLSPTLSIFSHPALEDLFLLHLSILSWVFLFVSSLLVLEWRSFWASYPPPFSPDDPANLSYAPLSILLYFLLYSTLIVLDSSYFSIPHLHIFEISDMFWNSCFFLTGPISADRYWEFHNMWKAFGNWHCWSEWIKDNNKFIFFFKNNIWLFNVRSLLFNVS